LSKYEDVQVRVLDQFAPGVGNAGEGEVRGAEVELVTEPVRGLKLEAGVGYLDTEITALGARIDPAADRVRVGNRFINSPEWSTNASAAYTWPVGATGDLTARVDWSWRDEVFNNWANDASIAQDALSLVNAAVTLRVPSDWEFVLAGRNLTDDSYVVTGNQEIDTFGYIEVVYARPREWSFAVRKGF
jgi:iron complex outermembrane receptor protein